MCGCVDFHPDHLDHDYPALQTRKSGDRGGTRCTSPGFPRLISDPVAWQQGKLDAIGGRQNMQAILLAAGTGRRLQRPFPKCLVDIGGMTLLSRALRALAAVEVVEVW